MPQRIDVPGMGIVEFPDGMSDDEIVAAIKRNSPQQTASPSALSQLGQGINEIPENLGSFTRGAVTEAVNLPAQAANLMLPKGIQFNTFPVEQNPMAQTGQSLTDLGSFFAGGAPAEAARILAEGIPYIGKAAKYLGKTGALSEGASMGLGSAAFGAVTNPNDPLQGAIQGGVSGGVAGALGEYLPKAFYKFKNPGSQFNPFYSPAEIARNAEAAKGTDTPLGEIIGDPRLMRKFSIDLPKNARSGAEQKMAMTARNIVNQGNEILENYLGATHPIEVNQKLGEALKNAYNNQKSMKRNLYQNVENLADQSNLKMELPKFSQLANEYASLINDTNFLKYEPESKQLISRLANYKNPSEKLEGGLLDASGKEITNIKYPSLQEANILAGKLGSMANTHSHSPAIEDQYLTKIYGNLAKSLKSDIRSSIDQSGNEELKNSFNLAEKNYKQNYAPFLDKQIYQFISGKKSPDELVSNFIKTGKSSDQGDKLNKLMSKLSPEDQNLVKYSYFSRALEGDETSRFVHPTKFSNLWYDNKLGPKQRQSLIPDMNERKQIENYSRLSKMNNEALKRTILPQTGIRGVGEEKKAPEIVGALIGAAHGGTPQAILGAITGRIVKDYVSKRALKNLTDEAIRNKLISQINHGKVNYPSKSVKIIGMASPTLNAISQSLMANRNQR